jgi:hypothetical protein
MTAPKPNGVRSGCSPRIKMQRERFEEFRLELASNIRKTICDLRDDGILAMSRNNLLQVTPSPKVARGPIGTNARWAYERIFDEVIDQLPRGYRRFVQDDCSIIAAAMMGGAR